MKTVKIVYWQESDGFWLGYLQNHPDYYTQGLHRPMNSKKT
jgi:hypothetical protein